MVANCVVVLSIEGVFGLVSGARVALRSCVELCSAFFKESGWSGGLDLGSGERDVFGVSIAKKH